MVNMASKLYSMSKRDLFLKLTKCNFLWACNGPDLLTNFEEVLVDMALTNWEDIINPIADTITPAFLTKHRNKLQSRDNSQNKMQIREPRGTRKSSIILTFVGQMDYRWIHPRLGILGIKINWANN
jgi:hypothetical protein